MMDKFAIFDYAEKGALADYEKACIANRMIFYVLIITLESI